MRLKFSMLMFLFISTNVLAKTLCPGSALETNSNLSTLEKLSNIIEPLSFPEDETKDLCELICWNNGTELDDYIKYYMRNIPGDDDFRLKKFYKEVFNNLTCPSAKNLIGPFNKMCTNKNPERIVRVTMLYRSPDLIDHFYKSGINYNEKDPIDGLTMVEWSKKLCETETHELTKDFYCLKYKRIKELASITGN